MPHTDMTEKGLETIMVEYLRNHNGYEQGQSADFDREYTLDPGRVERFIRSTQPDKVEQTMCFTRKPKTQFFPPSVRQNSSRRNHECATQRIPFQRTSVRLILPYSIRTESVSNRLLPEEHLQCHTSASPFRRKHP